MASLAFYMAPTQLPFLLSDLGSGPALIGVVIAASTLSSVAGALVFSRLRRTPSTIAAAGVALLGAGWILIGTAGISLVTAGPFVGGIGVGVAVPNLNHRLSTLAHPGGRGLVLRGLVVAIFLGQFLSPLAVQPLARAIGIPGTFTWSGVAMVAAALSGLLILTFYGTDILGSSSGCVQIATSWSRRLRAQSRTLVMSDRDAQPAGA